MGLFGRKRKAHEVDERRGDPAQVECPLDPDAVATANDTQLLRFFFWVFEQYDAKRLPPTDETDHAFRVGLGALFTDTSGLDEADHQVAYNATLFGYKFRVIEAEMFQYPQPSQALAEAVLEVYNPEAADDEWFYAVCLIAARYALESISDRPSGDLPDWQVHGVGSRARSVCAGATTDLMQCTPLVGPRQALLLWHFGWWLRVLQDVAPNPPPYG